MNIVLKKDGTATTKSGEIGEIGHWWRVHNGLVDRGVKLGNWQGASNATGQESPEFAHKCDLVAWFAKELDA